MTPVNDEFSKAVAAFVKKTRIQAEVVVRKIALDLLAGFVMKTPVDTGRARGSWMVGVNAIARGDGGVDKMGNTTIARGQAPLAAFKRGDTIYITSNLSYMPTLEYGRFPNPAKSGVRTSGGFSTQAPQGMVRVTVAEVQKIIQDAVKGMQ